ncbi:MAG TPA: tetratricopeptide repeat protein [Ktedonobacteraceae bacterium]|nr:tetratricopeptide repeat protein [Ktedonobacteraceae bacterium]
MAITVSNEGNRQEAIQLYTEYLERNPKASAAYGNRANLYKALGDLEKAEADYKSAISLNPQDPVNRSNYARLLIEQNQEELAIEELKAAIASTSKYYDPFVQLGNLLKEKEPVMALAYLEEAVKLTSDAAMQTEYFEQVLKLQEKLGYHARAMSSIRRLIDLNPASQKTNVWKERFARLNAAYRQDAEKYRVVNGEASLAAMARSVLDSTGWRVDHAGLQWMRVISDKQKDLSPLLVLLLDVPQVTEDVVHERISALESDEKEIKGLLLLANTDVIARDARIYIVQRDYPVALITAMEIREALLRGRQHCDVLIENALKRAKERRDPFSYKQLVSERSEFFGRESRKEEFTALLLRHELVGLYGIHKIGKSSFLRQVRQHLAIQARHITPVWIEMSTAIKNPPDLYRDILRELMGGVARIEQKVLTSERFQQELYAFQKRRQQDGGSHQILLILDEYPYLLPGKSGKKGVTDYLEILGLFKILSQEGWFNFLPCGRTTALSNALSWPEGENPFIGMLQEQFLEPLTREEVDELITVTGAKAGMKFKDEAIECMWTMAGGHPSFTRELGSRILRERSGITRVINRSMVEEAVEGILHSGTELNLLRKIYQQELEEEEQRIVAKLAISNQPLALPQLFPDNATTDERRQVRTAVENLVATSVISEDGQKHFSHRYELLRRVILQDLE